MPVTIKASSNNLYFRFFAESDMAIISTAMTGVDPFGVLPDEQVQKAFYYSANRQNEAMFHSRTLTDDDKGRVNFTVCKNDDTVIGYWIGKYLGKRFNQLMSALIPSERGNGFYRELTVLKHRFIFDSLKAEKASIVIPTSTGTIETPVRTSLDSLYSSTEVTQEIANKGEYRRSVISADDWTAWLNDTDNATQKARSYSIEWSSG